MKSWPKNDKPADFEDMVKTGIAAVQFAYKLTRKNKGKSIPVVGVDAPENAGCPSGEVTLNSANLKYSEEEQGRCALEEIIGVVLRIGIEQGRRIEKNNTGREMTKIALKGIVTMTEADQTPEQMQAALRYIKRMAERLSETV